MNGSSATELKRLIGEKNVKTGASALSAYFKGKSGDLVLVTPENPEQLSDLAAFAWENDIPLYSVKRRKFENGSAPSKPGLLIDLVKMNAIKKIDVRNLTAHVYGGVTFEQLQQELDKENQKILFPVTGKSPFVLRSYLDRDMLMGSTGYRHLQYSVFHAMLANGEHWVSGSQQMTDEGHADFREDQGPQFSPFFGASEDIFGIPYYGLIYTYPVREERRVVAFGFEDLGAAKDLLYKVARAEWCFEAFAANDRLLSVLLAGGDSAKVAATKRKLSPWTAVFSVEHYKDLVDLWERYIKEAAKDLGAKSLKGQVPEGIEAMLAKPWYLWDREYVKGGARDVTCYQYFKNVPDTFAQIDDSVKSAGLKPEELGKLVVPTYFGGAAYCEADLLFEDKDEDKADAAYLKTYETLLDAKAFVDKPVGKVAEMLYSRTDASYVNMIKLFKHTVDPKGLMNPDQLLEGV